MKLSQVKEYACCGEGWHPLLDTLVRGIGMILGDRSDEFYVADVKEKFGGLRFYYDTAESITAEEEEAIEMLVLGAECMAEATCEVCGNHGKNRRKNGWYKTRCEECDSNDM